MRLATITNWAYGATVALTFLSGGTMLLASNAQEGERAAVAQRFRLDQATASVDEDVLSLTDHARQFVITGDPTYRLLYTREVSALGAVEDRARHVRDAGASPAELAALHDAIRWADTLHDEQRDALAAYDRGDRDRARQVLFGAEYERELDRVSSLIERFQTRLDQRTEGEVVAATHASRFWRSISEATLAVTALLFLCVLFFVFRQRVLRPVVRLSDVVTRLAREDYAAETPEIDQIDEIGDIAQAIRIFRENGLERQRLIEERNATLAMRDLLSRMTQRMQGCDTLLDLKEVVARFVPEIAPDLAGRLYLLDSSRNAVVEACAWLDPKHSRREFSPMGCWAVRRGLPHRPAGDGIDVPCDHLDHEDGALADTLCLPLIAQRETLGLLYFEPRADSGHPQTAEVYLRMLAENIGLALGNLKLRDALREMAMADPLTGLANRRQLDAVLETQLAEADRLNRPISCLMIDLDHFKRINDSFGHDAGDAVLREIGAALRHATREQDLVFRYGGEEFLLLVGLDTQQAAERAEALRARMAGLSVRHRGHDIGPITISIGVATAPVHCPVDQLVRTADAALYRAKALGRDRVEVAAQRRASDAA